MSSLVDVKNISGDSSQGNQSVLHWRGHCLLLLRGIPFVSRFVLHEDGEQILPNVA